MKPTLVIVDDIQSVRERLRTSLESEFDVVGLGASGAEAIFLCRKHNPELVLMDLVMPTISGIEATRAILETSSPKIVVLSALQDENTVLRALEAGAAEYLVKPVSEGKIREVLKSLAGKKAA